MFEDFFLVQLLKGNALYWPYFLPGDPEESSMPI